MIRVTEVEMDSTGERQRFEVTVYRSPMRIIDPEAPAADLPEDVRTALLSWLATARISPGGDSVMIPDGYPPESGSAADILGVHIDPASLPAGSDPDRQVGAIVEIVDTSPDGCILAPSRVYVNGVDVGLITEDGVKVDPGGSSTMAATVTLTLIPREVRIIGRTGAAEVTP